MIYSTKKEIGELFRSILPKKASLIHYQLNGVLKKTSNFQFILAGCDYNCRLDTCLKKFTFLYQNRTIPFAIIRPLILRQEFVRLPGFSLSLFQDQPLSASQKNILEVIKNSIYYAGSLTFHILPCDSLYVVVRVQRKIAESPEESFNLSSLARILDRSRSWLSLKFKMLSGISLQSFLIKMRCCYALWQLISTEKLIKQIALEAGYKPLYFSQLFHKLFKAPPSSIRSLLGHKDFLT